MFRTFTQLFILFVGVACSTPSAPLRAPASSFFGFAANGPIDEEVFSRELAARISRVHEFKAIAEWGARNGVRVWGAGGTATGLAVYLKQDLEREALKKAGRPSKYFEGRFTYNYFDIFRSTQDADIVIDGTEANAKELEAFLQENFKYLEGSKSVWEVRLLDKARGSGAGEKDPLLGFNFQNQNSDSFSTGMIEITEPKAGDARVRDLFEWEKRRDTRFLRDVLAGEITFYRNPKHFQTKRAIAGMNPEILSAIRALTKAFQYEAAIRPEDEAELRRIIEAFDAQLEQNDYVTNQISKNGQKLFWHSPDVERAWNDLERLGLRRKLVQFGKTHKKAELATWLDREPLRTGPLGRSGKTASELRIEVVAHETNSFIAYENISRSLKGKPNVFTSRDGYSGEVAAFGDGFYTRIGKKGARNTGLTIRFELDPNAREGVDFILKDDFVIVRNASALRVIDESLNLSPLQYFELLTKGEFSADDKGMLDKLKLRMQTANRKLSAEEESKILKMVTAEIDRSHEYLSRNVPPLVSEWLLFPGAGRQPALLERCLAHYDPDVIVMYPVFTALPSYSAYVKETVLNRGTFRVSTFVKNVLASAEGRRHRDFASWVSRALEIYPEPVAKYVLNFPEVRSHPFFEKWIDRAMEVKPSAVVVHLLSRPEYVKHPRFADWIERIIDTEEEQAYGSVLENVLARPDVREHPKFRSWIERALKKSPHGVVNSVLPHLVDYPLFTTWVDAAIKVAPLEVGYSVLELPRVMTHEKYGAWIDTVLKAFPNASLGDGILSQPEAMRHPRYSEWVETSIRRGPGKFARNVLDDSKLIYQVPDFARWIDLELDLGGKGIAAVLNIRSLMNHPKYVGWTDRLLKLRPLDFIDSVLGHSPEHVALPQFVRWMDEALRDHPARTIEQTFSRTDVVRHPRFSAWVKTGIEVDIARTAKAVFPGTGNLKHPDFWEWVSRAIAKDPQTAIYNLLMYSWKHDIASDPRYSRAVIAAIRADPTVNFDEKLKELHNKGAGTLLVRLCPNFPITTACLRKRLAFAKTRDSCLDLLAPILKSR